MEHRHDAAFPTRWRLALVFAGLSGALSVVLSSCSSFTRTEINPPQVAGATFVGNNACADCHAPVFRHYAGSIHDRVHGTRDRLPGGTSCESCHGPGSKHIASGGGRMFIVNPGKDPLACFNCHVETHAEFKMPHRHPVIENRMNCVQCHDPHGSDIRKPAGLLAMARENESCASCHREQAGPFVFEHEALREGCTVCHNPHGSVHRKMLVEDNANLCLKCHAQVQGGGGEVFIGRVPHGALLRQGTCWTAGCHTTVHGSNLGF